MSEEVSQVPQVPQVTEVTVNYNGSGKVAIEEYGKNTPGYGVSVTRKYSVPADWDEDQIRIFELEKVIEIRENIDPILQEEYDNLMAQRTF